MDIRIPHHSNRQVARKKVEEMLGSVRSRFSHLISDLEERWEGDVLHFGFKAKGLAAKGTVEVTDHDIELHSKLPFLAMAFEGKIKSAILEEGKRLFGTR